MSPETLAALDASIKHWEENVAAEKPSEASTGGWDCALCAKSSNDDDELDCKGCPVAQATGYPQCDDSPWVAAHFALDMWRLRPSDSARGAFREAALAELNFLKALRPIG